MARQLQYAIAAVFLLLGLIFGTLLGYQRGHHVGIKHWQQLPITIKSYTVRDLVEREEPVKNRISPAELTERIEDVIKENVLPNFWDDNAKITINAFPENKSLIVSGNAVVHAAVQDFVQGYRKDKTVRLASASRALAANN